ncbi:hypothetical protein MIZ01_0793 [Sideroxyarcus emersonii]|uniref:CopZ zinc binding domain-containing protein n=1 Tax=Sideroxyarcus emersonii TaxID=2764705 RepID=A0AAN2BYF8_9PROT|nr:hypothetical protein [Sideroxyarcus emersonii]BCK87023.1 hypothetical protein MIZ01_0793 [Sideroxyarcus emersonii]
MTDCCSSPDCKTELPNRHRCPANGLEYAEVSVRTIHHHIKASWSWTPTASRYFFCDDPACDVVYFGDDDSTIVMSQLRTRTGIKERSDDSPLCYCFGICNADLRQDPAIRDFVIAQTKAGRCSCATSNPSGRCCLKDFPKARDTASMANGATGAGVTEDK